MNEIVAMIDHMQAKGIACNVILEAVRALSLAKEDAIEERRANDRARKSRERAAKRQALKTQELSHVTSADSVDSTDTETPPPLVSPLPSPKPPTNPPIIPPSSENPRAHSKREANGSRLPADWTLTEDWMAEALKAQPDDQPKLTAAEISHEADKFRDYWHGQPGAKGRKLDWLGTWRNWIRRAAPEILRARSRAGGVAAGRGAKPASRFAPEVSQHDAFALAGAAASLARGGSVRCSDDDARSGPAIGYSGPEVIDFPDARGTGARRAGGDRGDDGPSLFPLPIAAGR